MSDDEIQVGPFIARDHPHIDHALLTDLQTQMTTARQYYETCMQRIERQTTPAQRKRCEQQASVAYHKWEAHRREWAFETVQQTVHTVRGRHTLFVDFHYATKNDLKEWLPSLLQDARQHGFRQMELITGFGSHSESGTTVLLPFFGGVACESWLHVLHV